MLSNFLSQAGGYKAPQAGGCVAPQAARRPLSASILRNPRQKVFFARLGRGSQGGGPGGAVPKSPYLASSSQKYLILILAVFERVLESIN